jgi:hypothetical protein
MKSIHVILLPLMISLFVGTSAAGVYLSKDLHAGIGILTNSEKVVNFSSTQIIATLPKENLLWYDADPGIDTFLKAAEKAQAQNQSALVVRKLYEFSIRDEQPTALSARKALTTFDEKARATLEAKRNASAEASTLPQSSIRGSSANDYATVKINYENTGFSGYIRYPTYAVVNGKVYTFYTPQPIFSKTHINTTVNVSTPLGAK